MTSSWQWNKESLTEVAWSKGITHTYLMWYTICCSCVQVTMCSSGNHSLRGAHIVACSRLFFCKHHTKSLSKSIYSTAKGNNSVMDKGIQVSKRWCKGKKDLPYSRRDTFADGASWHQQNSQMLQEPLLQLVYPQAVECKMSGRRLQYSQDHRNLVPA